MAEIVAQSVVETTEDDSQDDGEDGGEVSEQEDDGEVSEQEDDGEDDSDSDGDSEDESDYSDTESSLVSDSDDEELIAEDDGVSRVRNFLIDSEDEDILFEDDKDRDDEDDDDREEIRVLPVLDMHKKAELTTIRRLWNQCARDFKSKRLTEAQLKPKKFEYVLKYLSRADDPAEALEEWELESKKLTSNKEYDTKNDGATARALLVRCICSHPIDWCYTMRHKTSGSRIIIGSDCYKRHTGRRLQ